MLPRKDDIELVSNKDDKNDLDNDRDESPDARLVRPLPLVGELHPLSEDILRLPVVEHLVRAFILLSCRKCSDQVSPVLLRYKSPSLTLIKCLS